MNNWKAGLILAWGVLLQGGVQAVESNAIQYDGSATTVELENPSPVYLTGTTLTFPLDWDSTLVPKDATKAVLIVRSADRLSNSPAQSFERLYPLRTATVTKPAASISCSFFDGAVPPRDAGIRATLNFISADDTTTNCVFVAWYQLAAGSFGAARILTVATNTLRWATLPVPADIHFDADWFGASPTYLSVTNFRDGVYHQGLSPLNGPATRVGVVPVDYQTTGPGSQKTLRIFAGNVKLREIAFLGGGGSIFIVR